MDIETPLRRARKFVSEHKRGVALAILAVIFLGGLIMLSLVLSPSEAGYLVGRLIRSVIGLVIVAFPLVGVTYLIVNRIMNRDSPVRVIRLSLTISCYADARCALSLTSSA